MLLRAAFFLKAITLQAKENNLRVKAILELYESMKIEVHEITHFQYHLYVLDAIFAKPIFQVSYICKLLNGKHNIHEKTVSDLLRQLKDAGILQTLESGSGRRSATMCFPKLLNLAEGRNLN